MGYGMPGGKRRTTRNIVKSTSNKDKAKKAKQKSK